MQKEEEINCPLSLVDWVNYLMQEQNTERFTYYNEEISLFTFFIVALTVMNIIILLVTLSTSADNKGFIQVVMWVGIILFTGLIVFVFLKLHQLKTRMKKITKREADLIYDIQIGEETDTRRIFILYREIFKNL